MKKLLSVLVFLSIFLLVSATSFSASEKVTLNFLEVHTSPSRTELLKEIISDFEEIHPDIQINLISPPYEQADQKATLMLNANEALDIIEVKDVSVKQFVNNKKLLNLESYLASWPDSKTLLPNAWQA
ncbi:MAG: extracellular solute-binding protein, partial [Bacteroidia bacterium]|nr:extracellular solute-binding protein [Bacteroidia bacterium]